MSGMDYSPWVNRTLERSDVIAPFPAIALGALLQRPTPLAEGDPLPVGWHWLYFLDAPGPDNTGPDGHMRRGDFLPPIALERRMWAAGRFETLEPLTIGKPANKITRIVSVVPKTGASGAMVFVTLEHLIRQEGRLRVKEEQTLVYRAMPEGPAAIPPVSGLGSSPAPAEERDAEWRATGPTDPVTLFRFSALTYNAHRIHYDRPYAQLTEHYPGLVVHGPYIAILLLDLAARHRRESPVRTFDFRATGPTFSDELLLLRGRSLEDRAELWSENPRGVGVTATAGFHLEASHASS